MQLEAKIISTHPNKSYCYQPCRDCRVCSWGTSTNEIPPNTQRCCLFPTIVTWYNSILLLKLLEQSRRKNISLHFKPLVSLCCLGLASFWNVVLPTSAPTSCHRIYQLTQGIVLLAALGNHIPDPFIKVSSDHRESKLDISWRLKGRRQSPMALFTPTFDLPATF